MSSSSSPPRRASTRRDRYGAWAVAGGLGACLAVLGVGCGSDDAGAKRAVQDFFAAVAAGNGAKACAGLTGKAVRQISTETTAGRGTCPADVKVVAGQLARSETGQLRKVRIETAKVDGDSATVRTAALPSELGAPGTNIVQLSKRSNRWLITAFGPTKLDTGELEKKIKQGIESQSTAKVKSVHCPGDRKLRKGDRFRCTVKTTRGQTVHVIVTQRDDKGNVFYMTAP